MAADHYIPGAVPSSLDDTADYPPLPESYAVPGAPPPPPVARPPQTTGASHATDTWVMPKLSEEPAAQASTEDLLRPYREERMQLRAELAVVNREREELQRQLDARSGSVRELERRLAEESARSTRAREEATELQGRGAGIASELEARGAELRSAEDKLRASEARSSELEARLSEREAQWGELEARLSEREAQLRGVEAERSGIRASGAAEISEARARAEAEVTELRSHSEAELADLGARLEAAQTELEGLRARFAAVQAELAQSMSERERQSAAHAAAQAEAERERARREKALAHSQEELSELHKRVAAHGEVLRRVEGQRYVFDAQLREREVMIDEAQGRVREAAAERARLAVELAAAVARAEEAEQRLAQRLEPMMAASPATPGNERAPTEPTLYGSAPSEPAPVAAAASFAPAAPGVDPALRGRIAALEAELADNRTQLESVQQKLESAERSEQALRAELDSRSLTHAAASAAAQPWPLAADEPTEVPHPSAPGVRGTTPAAAFEQLLVRTVGDSNIVHVLGRRTTIGRTPDNDLRIEADYVSRHHAVVLANSERVVVEDLNSTNGVYVNGARVTRRELLEGDVITIGDSRFRYVRKPVGA